MLDVVGLTSGYGNLIILRDISFTLKSGETLAVIGANGAGKSTLLWSLTGMIRPNKGKVLFEGKNIAGWDCSRIVDLGVCHVIQGMHVFSSLPVEDNLLLGAYGQQTESQRHLKEKLPMVYKYFPVLEKKRGQTAGSLSGGEKQMLAIGRALLSKLKLLMLDEPSAGLAPLLVKRMFEVLGDLRKELSLTILLVEQNAEAALRFSGRGLVLSEGRIRLEGEARSLIDNEEVKRIYLGKGASRAII